MMSFWCSMIFLISKHVHPFPKFEIRASSSPDAESCEDVTTDLRSLERHQKCLFHEPAKSENKCTYHNIFPTLVDIGFTKAIIIKHKFRSGHRRRSIHGPHTRHHTQVSSSGRCSQMSFIHLSWFAKFWIKRGLLFWKGKARNRSVEPGITYSSIKQRQWKRMIGRLGGRWTEMGEESLNTE